MARSNTILRVFRVLLVFRVLHVAIAAAALLASLTGAAASERSEPPAPLAERRPLGECEISLASLADRAELDVGGLSVLLDPGLEAETERAAPEFASEPPPMPPSGDPPAAAPDEPGETAIPITIDDGARLGCRLGSVVPYARLDLRTLVTKDALERRVAERNEVPVRALGVLFDIDPRTVLRLEAFLGPPDLAGAFDPGADDDRALGFAVQLALAF